LHSRPVITRRRRRDPRPVITPNGRRDLRPVITPSRRRDLSPVIVSGRRLIMRPAITGRLKSGGVVRAPTSTRAGVLGPRGIVERRETPRLVTLVGHRHSQPSPARVNVSNLE
jgi:hypothetical protein